MNKPINARLDFGTLRATPVGIWALGFVSMLMDISSEMIHALLPVYPVTVLGASTMTVGIAEATASITKVFSGTAFRSIERPEHRLDTPQKGHRTSASSAAYKEHVVEGGCAMRFRFAN